MPANMPASMPAISMRGISKRFGTVLANDNVDIEIAAGTIHGIVGENGAGKSTLMSILYGFYQADTGNIALHGQQPVHIRSAQDAIAHGVGMVHQHFMLVATLSALDNILLGAEQGFFLAKEKTRARAKLARIMEQHGLPVDLDKTVENMPVGEQQRLEILKTLYRDAKILILDEPTGVLTPQEVEALFGILEALRAHGVTVVIITHKLHEIMRITDNVTVMRGGKVVAERVTKNTSPAELAELMVGRPINMQTTRKIFAPDAAQERLRVENLNYVDAKGVARVRDVSFTLHAGEILGLAGVSGNGQSELLALLAGLLKPSSGSLTLQGAANSAQHSDAAHKSHKLHKSYQPQVFQAGHWLEPAQLRALGGALVPEDRLGEGVIKDFAMQESAILGYQADSGLGKLWHLDTKRIAQRTRELIKQYDVRPAEPQLRTANMSGGNQQKLVLGREMAQQPGILLIGQPTRGVDIGAIEQIYAALIAARDAGAAILLVSVELEEIFTLSDRIAVMNQGAITGVVHANTNADANGGEKFKAAEIGNLMTKAAA